MKIKIFLVVFLAVFVTSKEAEKDFKFYSLNEDDVTNEWSSFKLNHKKSYRNSLEENYRFKLFRKALFIINKQNEKYKNGTSTFAYGVNRFTDMTSEEFLEFVKKTGLSVKNDTDGIKYNSIKSSRISLPLSVDWTQSGYVAPIRNQGSCGSCWAFSAISSLEFYNFKVNGIRANFSEQQLVDCKYTYDGCQGGWMTDVFTYAKNGITTQNTYPYVSGSTGIWQSCIYTSSQMAIQTTGYTVITNGIANETLVTEALANVGPLSVAVYVTSGFQYYSSGVFVDTTCPSNSINHGVNLIGYGSQNGQDYYILRNSWGTNWGQNGYMLFKRDTLGNSNQCSIASYASYPNVKAVLTTTASSSTPSSTTSSTSTTIQTPSTTTTKITSSSSSSRSRSTSTATQKKIISKYKD